MKDFLHHLILPRESNKHRAKILHHDFLLLLIVFFLSATVITTSIKDRYPQVLGDTANVTIDQLLQDTNQKRIDQGLPALTLNSQLSQAAALKAEDMFAKNYWAHNSPDGLTPWVFIGRVGYSYSYAGENLARGFTDSDSVVNAWMASESHRENVLSTNYQQVGFAIQKGTLGGEDTILVVEMFGGQTGAVVSKQTLPPQQAKNVSVQAQVQHTEVPVPTKVPTRISYTPQTYIIGAQNNPLVNSKALSTSATLSVVGFIIMVLLLDMIVVERKQIVRLVGHNVDHVLFLGSLLVLALIFGKGVVL